MNKPVYEEWLRGIRERLVKQPGKHAARIRELAQSFTVEEKHGQPIVRCPLLERDDDEGWSDNHRVYLSELNAMIRQSGPPVNRFFLSKKRGMHHLDIVPVEPSLTVRSDVHFQDLCRELSALPRVGRVIILQHSGLSVTELIRLLLGKGAHIELYLQDPAYTCNSSQAEKVRVFQKDARNLFRENLNKGCLTVYHTKAPCSLRAMSIDDRLLICGWYTYHQISARVTPRSGIDLQGHLRPMVVVEAGHPAYTVLDEMFRHVLEDVRAHRGRPVLMIPPQSKAGASGKRTSRRKG